jgi:hypothetical protein
MDPNWLWLWPQTRSMVDGHGMALLNDTDGGIWNMPSASVESDVWVLIVDVTLLVRCFLFLDQRGSQLMEECFRL